MGPHLTDDGIEVTAWLPHARSAWLLIAGIRTEMTRGVNDGGMYRAISPAREYQIEVQLYNDDVHVIDDPYRFPPILTPFELHLHGEGTNYESYRTLGAHVMTCEGAVGLLCVRSVGSQRADGQRDG